MVAVTILLALLVIAAFVFGMAGNIQKTKVVAATAAQSGNDIIVTYQGGQDAATVTQLNVILVDDNVIRTITAPLVGNASKYGGGTTGRDHVTVSAVFNDGSQQVILDTYV